MKRTRQYTNCEYCDKMIEVVSPYTKEQYEQGLIHISDASVAVPDRIATLYGGSHTRPLDGYYCDFDCLLKQVRRIMNGMAL